MSEIVLNEKFDDEDYVITIGRNAKNNWEIIDKSEKNDVWFHLANYPSSHIILKSNGSKINKKAIKFCAVKCKERSKYKSEKDVKIIYTKIKNIVKGDDVGSVITSKTKVLTI